MKATDDVEFNGYSVRAIERIYGITPTPMNY